MDSVVANGNETRDCFSHKCLFIHENDVFRYKKSMACVAVFAIRPLNLVRVLCSARLLTYGVPAALLHTRGALLGEEPRHFSTYYLISTT